MRKTASWAAAEIVKEASDDGNSQHRGRIQIQNNTNLKAGLTVSWSTKYPPTKKDGRRALATLENELAVKDYKMYKRLTQCGAFDKAVEFINNSPIEGRAATGKSQTMPCRGRVNGERIDLKLLQE